MGGYGAVVYAAQNPGLFTAVASFSGSLDITYPSWIPIFEAQGTSANGNPALWGSFAEHPEVWREHNPVDLASKLRGTKLYLYTGNGQPGGKFGDPGDPVEPAIEQMNLAFVKRLKQLNIPFYFDDYGPGGHNILYAIDDLTRVLPNLMGDLSPPQD
jgi:diacylglycerol O-acyltransferase/trehalose O-mycolyltransferase